MHDIAEAEEALDRAEEALARLDREAVVAHLSSAIRVYTGSGMPREAAMVCARLGDTMANLLGNHTAARAWFERGIRLVEDLPPCIEQGWLAVAALGCDVDDPLVLLERAELALDRARHFGDLNLETKALADGGLAHVQAGRVVEGMAWLDEAMALACGPADNADTTSRAVCSFFTACYFTADFGRASTWAGLLRQHGLIGGDSPEGVFLSSHCDSVQATLLMEMGRWSEAEAILERSIAEFEAFMGTPAWHPAIALADLRTRQGRFADAEALLLGKEQAMQALLPAARLHLERGDPDLAVATAERGLRAIGTDRLRAVELLALLIDAHLALDDARGALAACERLRELTGEVDVPALNAQAGAALARLTAATGDIPSATAQLERVLELLDADEVPWLRARLLLELARLHQAAGDAASAARVAGDAAVAMAKLDVALSAADALIIEQVAADRSPTSTPAAAARAAGAPAVLGRDGKWWIASHDGTTVRLRGTKGLAYLAELVAAAGAERHALDLVDRVEGVGLASEPDRRSLGDAGPLADTRARRAYRHRIESLREDIADALEIGQLETAERLQDELDALVAHLAQAFGLGGRDRVAGSAAERARLNVTRALRSALASLSEALPVAGADLDRRVRTGMYCAYEPADGEVRWIVQS